MGATPAKQLTAPDAWFLARYLLDGAPRYLLRCLKNLVKVLIGRAPYFSPRDRLYVLVVRAALARRPIQRLTSASFAQEGAGSQAFQAISALAIARLRGLTYVHTPFATIQHADRPMDEWVRAWEALFNLGLGEIQARPSDEWETANFAWSPDVLSEYYRVGDLRPAVEAVIPELRRKYYANTAPRANADVVVSVHVRRGDISAAAHPDRWIDTAVVARTIARVRSGIDACGLACRIHVFSQGERGELSALDSPGVDFFLDAEPVWTMQELVESDVLVMGGGMFSYVAALLSDGITIAPFTPTPPRLLAFNELAPLGDWLLCRADGDFDVEAFEARLRAHAAAKREATEAAST